MQLLIRSARGVPGRPKPVKAMPDFDPDHSGELVFATPGIEANVGIYVMAGDDTDPPTHYQYDAELYELPGALVVRVWQYQSRSSLRIPQPDPETVAWRVSADGGRSWQDPPAPPGLDAARRIDRIAAG